MSEMLIFWVKNQNYAMSLETVDEILPMMELRPATGKSPYLEGLLILRGESIPVVDLRKYWGHSRDGWPVESRIVILKRQSKKQGFIVDGIRQILSAEMDSEMVRLESGEVMEFFNPEKAGAP